MMKAFVISPIGKQGSKVRGRADEVLKLFMEPAAARRGYVPCRGDQLCTPGLVMPQLVRSLLDASLIMAYVVGNNPNVFYELAVAHTLRKPVVMLAEPRKPLPFDIAGARVIELNDADPSSTINAIVSQIDSLHAEGFEIKSPIEVHPPQLLRLLTRTGPLTAAALPDLTGRWSGYTVQDEGPEGERVRYDVGMRLDASNEYFIGEMTLNYGDDLEYPARNSVHLNIHGSIQGGRFIIAQYDNPLMPHHCGQAFLESQRDGNELVGRFMGFGIQTQRIVTGTIVLLR